MKKKKKSEILVYDRHETTSYIDRKKRMKLADIGIELPPEAPTRVLSLRVSTTLLNKIKAYAGQHDVPYSSIIKILLAEGIESKFQSAEQNGKR